jgi:hypothetical protein
MISGESVMMTVNYVFLVIFLIITQPKCLIICAAKNNLDSCSERSFSTLLAIFLIILLLIALIQQFSILVKEEQL